MPGRTGAGLAGAEAAVVRRLTAEVTAALRRRPPNEERLSGALRVLGASSEPLRELLEDAGRTLGRRGALGRPLFEAAARTLAEAGDDRAEGLLKEALPRDPQGGDVPGVLALLSAAGCCRGEGLAEALHRAAVNRHAHVALAAGVARLERGEGRGEGLADLALRLKEAHRVAVCGDILEPLARRSPPSPELLPALSVLRGAERYLGRWLLLAGMAARSGDVAPLGHAEEQAEQGPVSARGAWALVAWALSQAPAPPPQRASLDVLMRLSDRPFTERDLSFLFRLADARALQLRALLEGLAEKLPLGDESAARAAFYLARDHGRDDLRKSLADALKARREGGWGVAAAALHDLGERAAAEAAARACLGARSSVAMTWGLLVLRALENPAPLLTETHCRRLNVGLLS